MRRQRERSADSGCWSSCGETRHRNAVRDLERAIELTAPSPGQGSLFSFLGNVRAQLGERRAARDAYREAIRLDPASRRAYVAEMKELVGR